MLHILDSDLDFQTRRIADDFACACASDMRIERRIIGTGGDHRGIASAALRLRHKEMDFVQTFGRRSLLAAAMVFSVPIVHTLAPESSRSELRWINAICAYRSIRVVCSSDFDLRRAVSSGLQPERCTLIHPGVDFSKIKPGRDAEFRSKLGLVEDDYVILAPGESTSRSRHELACWACAILSELDERYKILFWPRGPRASAIMRNSYRWRRPDMVRFAEPMLGRPVEPEELLSAADAVLVTAGDGAATLPIAMSMAAGLPIVSVVNRTTSELLEDRHTAAMVGTNRPRDLARRIQDVRDDANLQWGIADRTRAEAYEHFSLARATQQWRMLYEEMKDGASATLVKPNLR